MENELFLNFIVAFFIVAFLLLSVMENEAAQRQVD